MPLAKICNSHRCCATLQPSLTVCAGKIVHSVSRQGAGRPNRGDFYICSFVSLSRIFHIPGRTFINQFSFGFQSKKAIAGSKEQLYMWCQAGLGEDLYIQSYDFPDYFVNSFAKKKGAFEMQRDFSVIPYLHQCVISHRSVHLSVWESAQTFLMVWGSAEAS